MKKIFLGLLLAFSFVASYSQTSIEVNNATINQRLRVPRRDTTGAAYCGEIRLRQVSGDTSLYLYNCRTTGKRWEKIYTGVTILDNRGNLDTLVIPIVNDTLGIKSVAVTNGGNLVIFKQVTDSTINYFVSLGKTISVAAGEKLTIEGNEYVGDFKTNTIDSFEINANSIMFNGAFALMGRQEATSGTSVTLNSNTITFLLNPNSAIASYTIILPASPKDGQMIYLEFGGVITSGTVATALTVIPNGAQGIIQPSSPSTAVAGDAIIYHYKESNQKWYRIK